MKPRLAALTLGAALLGGAWLAWSAVSPFVIPFQPVKSFRAFSQTAGTASLFLRKPDGTFMQLTFGKTSPYRMLTSLAALGSLLTNPGAFLAAPAGPANVGRAAQLGAGGIFTSSGGLGGAWAFPGSRQVTVYLGTSALLYTGSQSYPLSSPVSNLVAEDINGDRVLDLVLGLNQTFGSNPAPGGVGVMLNQGNGTFAPMVKYTAGTSVESVAVLDLNRDGRPDIATADNSSGTLQVLLGNGNGTFQAALPVPTPSANTLHWSVTIADVTGDGNLDLAASGQGAITIVPGNGDGTFGQASRYVTRDGPLWGIVAGDFTGDGRLDLAVCNGQQSSATVFINTGTGQFQERDSYALTYNPHSLLVADVNHDGKLDLVNGIGDARWFGPSFSSFTMDILYGGGDGSFAGTPVSPVPGGSVSLAAVADFSGDGRADAVAGSYFGNNVFYYEGQPGDRFAAQPQTISLGTGPQVLPTAAVAGDFNGDQRPDLAVTESGPSRVAILLRGPTGFQAPSTFATGGQGSSGIAAADFDGDGKLDLAVSNGLSGQTGVLQGGGNGSFQLLAAYPTGTKPTDVAARDFTGDGRADLAVADGADGGKIHVLRNTGAGAFAAMPQLSVGVNPLALSLRDVNGDGRTDLIAAANGPSFTWIIGVALGNGDGTFRALQTYATDFGPTGLAVEDFDGDGNQDLFVTHCCGETNAGYYRGTGGGNFAPEAFLDAPVSAIRAWAVRLNPSDTTSPPDLVVATNQGGIMALPNTQKRFRNRNSASFIPGTLAADMIVTGEAPGIAPQLLVAQQTPWPLELGGVRVDVVDSAGTSRQAPIYYVSPSAVSYLIPAGTAIGYANVTLRSSTGQQSSDEVYVGPVAPGLYSANSSGSGAAAAFYLRVPANGERTQDLVFDATTREATAIDLGPDTDQVYLLLYGTGFRNATSVTARLGTRSIPVLGTAAHSVYQGLDQVNIGPLPRTLAAAGLLNVELVFDGQPANVVTVRIR